MFASHCTACDKRQLIFPSQVTGMVPHERAIILTYTCWCGAEQSWTAGAAADRRTPVAA